ncbi:hypothetical protein ABT324_30830 [Saccharopolyspora sp. NPDC000359]|uniref:hypothetical protein n=1 Tax=Saccharopolyspora sp. NPDC000359 TaxID=3154251 RepID=UPI0033277B93
MPKKRPEAESDRKWVSAREKASERPEVCRAAAAALTRGRRNEAALQAKLKQWGPVDGQQEMFSIEAQEEQA